MSLPVVAFYTRLSLMQSFVALQCGSDRQYRFFPSRMMQRLNFQESKNLGRIKISNADQSAKLNNMKTPKIVRE